MRKTPWYRLNERYQVLFAFELKCSVISENL